jgi:hypothetical protein
MERRSLFSEAIANYRRHGWELKRVLLRAETRDEIGQAAMGEIFGGAALTESEIDALWFARASHAGREAWELRLVSESPYALFETFEPEESEEEREDLRREMEARLRDYTSRGSA